MGIFNDILKDNESIFLDTVPLDFDYIPKMVPYREQEQRRIAECIKPLFQKRNGRNILIYGSPGIGKTVACRHILNELNEKTEDIVTIYINCWKKNTTFKVVLEICDIIGYRFTQNKNTDELFKVIKEKLNTKEIVFCLDEFDKLENQDLLYYILEDFYKKTVILITNYKETLKQLDERIKSRLTPDILEFKNYNPEEIKGILKERMKFAFVQNSFSEEAFNEVVTKTTELKDVRTGLYLLREAGNIAEEKSSKKVLLEHVKTAIDKSDQFAIKTKEDFNEDKNAILELIKQNSGLKIGDLFKLYIESSKDTISYKTFQRRINELYEGSFITLKKTTGGAEGTTSIVFFNDKIKTLNEFN